MDRRAGSLLQGPLPVRCALAACALSAAGCAASSPDYRGQQAFKSPAIAVESLQAAANTGDTAELEAIFGPDGREVLSSGDPVADRRHREVFAVALDQGWSLENTGSKTRELIVGHEEWPFPIPLVKDSHGWWFDTATGRLEILARRIGRNELAAIGILHTYVFAQREYASEGHDGKPPGLYAQQVRSDAGRHNGLYWPADDPGDDPSPLGTLAADAAGEGYSSQRGKGLVPFHGYFYKVLTRQGADAPGGAAGYVVNGDMTGGFAMVAYPAEYDNSGIMTFLVGPDGLVYESDLGQDTRRIAAGISEYNPDGTWRLVE